MVKIAPFSRTVATAALAPLCLIVCSRAARVTAFSAEAANMAKMQLHQALYSPSGKLTLSPEIVVPEPSDPTAILLQASEVTKLSDKIRTSAKANAAWISGSTAALRSFAAEQESARGNFPGPVPAIYCNAVKGGADGGCTPEMLSDIADSGAVGILLPVLGGAELTSPDEIKSDAALADISKAALGVGLQAIPEVTLHAETAGEWGEDDVVALVDTITEQCGSEPAAVVLTINSLDDDDNNDDGGGDEDEKVEEDEESERASSISLPTVPKSLGKKIPILGSVRALAGGGRMGECVASLKDAGFTGAFLRSDCVPGFRMNPDLDVVSSFWSAAIGDLKSVRSKSFGFRAKVALDRDIPMEWYNYQKDVMESGALGGPESGPGDLDAASGDFKGF